MLISSGNTLTNTRQNNALPGFLVLLNVSSEVDTTKINHHTPQLILKSESSYEELVKILEVLMSFWS